MVTANCYLNAIPNLLDDLMWPRTIIDEIANAPDGVIRFSRKGVQRGEIRVDVGYDRNFHECPRAADTNVGSAMKNRFFAGNS